MASRTPPQAPAATMAAESPRLQQRLMRPFEDFLGPARRRTDHPLVVGTIVLCLVVMTLSAVLNVVVVLWAGLQAQQMFLASATRAKAEDEQGRARDKATNLMRERIIKAQNAQADLAVRFCLRVAVTEADRLDCSRAFVLPPAPPPLPVPQVK